MKANSKTLPTIIASLMLLSFCYPAEPETENAADPGTPDGAIAHFALLPTANSAASPHTGNTFDPVNTLCDGGSILVDTIPATVPEGGGQSFQISLASPPTCEVIIVIASEDQTTVSVEGSDAASITFPANDNAARTVTLNGVEDGNIASETTTINLTDASGVLTPDSFSVNTIENDTGKLMFRSFNRYNGNLGGISGADSKCQADASAHGYPGIYKAMIAERNNRIACINHNCDVPHTRDYTDWVLTANTAYFRMDGTTQIGITNSKRIFNFDDGPLENGVTDEDRIFHWHWTGLDDSWKTFAEDLGLPQDCQGWTNGGGFPNYAIYGSHTTRGFRFALDSAGLCYEKKYLICVQQ